MRGEPIQPGDARYDHVRQVYNGMIDRRPALIACCVDVADVINAVNFARQHQRTLAIRGGGHSGPGLGTCDDGLVIDLSGVKGNRGQIEIRGQYGAGIHPVVAPATARRLLLQLSGRYSRPILAAEVFPSNPEHPIRTEGERAGHATWARQPHHLGGWRKGRVTQEHEGRGHTHTPRIVSTAPPRRPSRRPGTPSTLPRRCPPPDAISIAARSNAGIGHRGDTRQHHALVSHRAREPVQGSGPLDSQQALTDAQGNVSMSSRMPSGCVMTPVSVDAMDTITFAAADITSNGILARSRGR